MEVRLTSSGVQRFVSNRLNGRQPESKDAEFLARLHGDPSVMGFHGGPRPASTTEAFLSANISHWQHHRIGLWVLSELDSAEPIGWVALRVMPAAAQTNGDEGAFLTTDLSCLLAKPYWGRGYGTEAARSALTIASAYRIPVVAEVDTRHEAARRVAEKVGLRYESDDRRHAQLIARYRWPADAATGWRLSRQAPEEHEQVIDLRSGEAQGLPVDAVRHDG